MVRDIDELEWKGPPGDNITPGIHIAECIGSNVNEHYEKLFLQFQIVEGPDKGKTTFAAFRIPRDGRIHTSSKWYKTWTRLTGRHPSKENVKMSPRVFHGHYFRVRVELRYTHNNDGEPEYSEDHEYGYVTEILEEVASPVSS